MIEVECYCFTFLKDIGKIACLRKTKYIFVYDILILHVGDIVVTAKSELF